MGWHIHQMDVKTAFLNGVIEEKVYIEKLEGFEIFSSESHVCRLKRVLYGLKQSPHSWYTQIDSYFTGLGFSKSEADPNLYQIVVEGKLLIIGKYAWEILEKFNMHGYKPIDTPLPGGWRKEDATLAEEDEVKLCGFTDADWERSPTDRKNTSRGIFSIGSTTVSWYNRKQRFVALSSVEAEYMAASLAACEAIWMRKILVGLFGSHLEPTVIYCDNQSCIKLSANPVFHDRSKHIDISYHHIRDCVQQRIMLLSYIPTEDQDVDILTKALTKSKFEYHRGRIGVANNPYIVEREC
eukprot:PITA_01956